MGPLSIENLGTFPFKFVGELTKVPVDGLLNVGYVPTADITTSSGTQCCIAFPPCTSRVVLAINMRPTRGTLLRGSANEAYNLWGRIKLIKFCIGLIAAVVIGTQAHAQSDANSGGVFYPSCLAAADIVQGKHPAADSDDATKQLRRAAICFGAVTAIMNVEPFFKSEFAVCPPADTKVSFAQMILVITAYLKNHPERLHDNFHQLAVTALAAAWPCSK
jgi:hypothetical protein